MRRFLKISSISLGVLASIWMVARLTKAFEYYVVPSSANEPTIKMGEHFFASNLRTPRRFDFICYEADLPMMGRRTVLHRLCGLPGDTVLMSEGILYVNGKNVDSTLTIGYTYRLAALDYEKNKDVWQVNPDFVVQPSPDSVELTLNASAVKAANIATRKIVDELPDPNIVDAFGKNINRDNFGPVVVPTEKYFVLGDNRHGSQDSRYLGFISADQYVATVLRK